jgi:hypothetical protein
MKKILTFGIMLLFILMTVSSTAEPPTLNEDIKIKIYAGFLGFALDTPPLGGNIGFGTSIHIFNNNSEPIKVHELYEYWTLFGKYLGGFRINYSIPPNYTERFGDFGWPWHPVYLKITVNAGNTTASRSGFSICNLVILRNN